MPHVWFWNCIVTILENVLVLILQKKSWNAYVLQYLGVTRSITDKSKASCMFLKYWNATYFYILKLTCLKVSIKYTLNNSQHNSFTFLRKQKFSCFQFMIRRSMLSGSRRDINKHLQEQLISLSSMYTLLCCLLKFQFSCYWKHILQSLEKSTQHQ